MLNIGPSEILVILLVAFIVLGPEKLPEVGKFLGRFYLELKKGIKEVEKEIWEEETQKEKKQKKSSGE